MFATFNTSSVPVDIGLNPRSINNRDKTGPALSLNNVESSDVQKIVQFVKQLSVDVGSIRRSRKHSPHNIWRGNTGKSTMEPSHL